MGNTKSVEELGLEYSKDPKIGTYGNRISVHGQQKKKAGNKRKVRDWCSCGAKKKHKNINHKD